MFREKKTLSLGAKDTKKERTLLRALLFESGVEKAKKESLISRTHLVVDNSRAPNIARLCCCYYSCRLFSSHRFYTCVHVCAKNVLQKEKTFLLSIFGQTFSAQFSSCERKNEQSFPPPLSPPRKNKKRNDVSLLF